MKIGKRPARILLYEQVVEDLCLLIDQGILNQEISFLQKENLLRS